MVRAEEQALILVEESVPDGDDKEDIISIMAEDDVQSFLRQLQHNKFLHLCRIFRTPDQTTITQNEETPLFYTNPSEL